MKELTEIADKIIKKLIQNCESDPFSTPTLVFHNMKAAQWFKAYFLKTNGKVLMNVRFETLHSFLESLSNSGEKIMSSVELQNYVLRVLLEIEDHSKFNYIFRKDDPMKKDGNNLYEFSRQLAELFTEFENAGEEIPEDFSDLYQKAVALAREDNRITLKSICGKKDLNLPKYPVYVVNNSVLSKLTEKILEQCGDKIEVYSPETEASKEPVKADKMIAAPSLLREVEAVHSEICKIVKSTDARFNDILVYVPDVDVYANTIRRVFEQDGKEYPNIPFRIVGELKNQKDMSDSLNTLFDIATKRFFTRDDFNQFVRNPMIKRIHGFSDEDARAWMNAIVKTNAHRNGKANGWDWEDDWKYLKDRLLVGVFVSDRENLTQLNGKGYLPYSAIGLDRERINKLIGMIGKLQKWTALFTGDLCDVEVDPSKLERIRSVLDELYSVKDEDGLETNYLYRNVIDVLDEVKKNEQTVSADLLMMLLRHAPDRYALNPADMFMSGVTFLNLEYDNVVASNYVFVMGMSSDAFPRTETVSELGVSKGHVDRKELDQRAAYALRDGSDKLTVSYLNQDLQTDERLYPTPVFTAAETEEIPLDESRDYGELFTRREMRNREDYEKMTGMGKSGGSNEGQPETLTAESAKSEGQPETLTTQDFKKFCENTFIYKYKKILKTDEDEEEKIKKEYEAIDVEYLDEYSIVKKMIEAGVELGEDHDSDKLPESIEKKLRAEQSIPAPFFDAVKDAYWETAKAYIKEIGSGYTKTALQPVELKTNKEEFWTYSCKYEIYRKENDLQISYLEPVLHKGENAKDYLYSFAFCLLDLAQRTEENEYTVILWMPNNKEKTIFLKPDEARTILNTFYALAHDTSEIKYMDISLVEKEDKPDPNTLDNLIETIKNSNWKFFADANLVDPYRDFGYEESREFGDIFGDYKGRITQMISRILFEPKKSEKEN